MVASGCVAEALVDGTARSGSVGAAMFLEAVRALTDYSAVGGEG